MKRSNYLGTTKLILYHHLHPGGYSSIGAVKSATKVGVNSKNAIGITYLIVSEFVID